MVIPKAFCGVFLYAYSHIVHATHSATDIAMEKIPNCICVKSFATLLLPTS